MMVPDTVPSVCSLPLIDLIDQSSVEFCKGNMFAETGLNRTMYRHVDPAARRIDVAVLTPELQKE